MPVRRLVRLFAAVAAVGLAPPCAAQVFVPTTRVEVAEVRGLDAVPADPATSFDAATPGTAFDAGVKAVFVRFRASAPPQQGASLFVNWVRVPVAGDPVTLRRRPVDASALTGGLVDVLSEGGKPLANGRYIVSLVGSDDALLRAVEFRIGARPPIQAGPTTPVKIQRVYFDEYSVAYPNVYTPQPSETGMMKGVFLRRTAPFGMMFAMLSEAGTDTVLPQGRAIAQLLLRRLGAAEPQSVESEVADVPADKMPPGMLVGKTMDVAFRRGMSARVNFYSKDVDGRRVLFGYMTISGQGVPAEYEPLLSTDPEGVEKDFFAMVGSFKGGTPYGAKTPGEPRP